MGEEHCTERVSALALRWEDSWSGPGTEMDGVIEKWQMDSEG